MKTVKNSENSKKDNKAKTKFPELWTYMLTDRSFRKLNFLPFFDFFGMVEKVSYVLDIGVENISVSMLITSNMKRSVHAIPVKHLKFCACKVNVNSLCASDESRERV